MPVSSARRLSLSHRKWLCGAPFGSLRTSHPAVVLERDRLAAHRVAGKAGFSAPGKGDRLRPAGARRDVAVVVCDVATPGERGDPIRREIAASVIPAVAGGVVAEPRRARRLPPAAGHAGVAVWVDDGIAIADGPWRDVLHREVASVLTLPRGEDRTHCGTRRHSPRAPGGVP